MSVLCTLHIVDAADHVNAMYFALVPPHLSQGLLCTPSPPNDSIVKVGCPPTALQPSVNTPWVCTLRTPQEYLRGHRAARCLTTWRLGGRDTDKSEPLWDDVAPVLSVDCLPHTWEGNPHQHAQKDSIDHTLFLTPF